MKAVVAKRYGGPEVLEIVDAPAPEVHSRDVLIDVRAASLNPLDFKVREGKVKLVLPLKPPVSLGCDVAGVVSAVGPNVKELAVGDEVYVRLEKQRMGGLAEQACADASVVAKKPASLSFEQAASIPLAALTALQALREVAKLTPGQRVLIHAGAGGVGSLAIQIAKILGLHVTTTTSTKNVEFVRGLGADEVIDYTKESLDDKPREFDAVFDSLGAESEIASIRATKRGGIVVGIGGLPDGEFAKEWLPTVVRPALWLMTAKRRRVAAKAGVRFVYLFMRPDGGELAEIARWIDEGKLTPIIHATFPFSKVRDAFAELERGRARGKIVVTI
ncbi:MAG: NADP-dependent oxidoreductase [Kofleriaceae bacterium]